MSSETTLTSQISSAFSVCTLASLWAATPYVSDIYDLTGTLGLGFYWWGAENPPEALNQLVLMTPTGFWYTTFYDGLARWRLVKIPWGSFIWVSRPQRLLEPHHHGFEEPDKSQIRDFIWTVHTAGLRRLDYVHAPRAFPSLKGIFIARHSQIQEWSAGFIIRRSLSQELGAGFIIRRSLSQELGAGFIIRRSLSQELGAGFIVRQKETEDLKAGFDIAP